MNYLDAGGGDMSLVSPHAFVVYKTEEYVRWRTRRFDIAPGSSGRRRKKEVSFKGMICLAVRYRRNPSLLQHLKLLTAATHRIAGELQKAIRRRLGRT